MPTLPQPADSLPLTLPFYWTEGPISFLSACSLRFLFMLNFSLTSVVNLQNSPAASLSFPFPWCESATFSLLDLGTLPTLIVRDMNSLVIFLWNETKAYSWVSRYQRLTKSNSSYREKTTLYSLYCTVIKFTN